VSSVDYVVELTPIAEAMLAGISDRNTRRKIAQQIDELTENPGAKGKPLVGALAGYRSVRAAGQRYRIIYRIVDPRVQVVAIGIRKEKDKKDIYRLAEKLWHSGKLS
jgi:mRNA interferase RelE/StbE